MDGISVGGIVKTSIVTAFMIAAALIWKDFISEAIEIFFPQEVLFYKFIAAIIATIFVIIAIYIILKTEEEAEIVFDKVMDYEKNYFRRNKDVPKQNVPVEQKQNQQINK